MNDHILDEDFREKKHHSVEYVGFMPRVGAAIIDFFVFIPFLVLLMLNLVFLKSLGVDILLTLLMAVYKPFFEFNYGATLGKSVLKIKVVNSQFEKIDLKTSLIRNIGYYVPSLLGIFQSFLLFSNPEFQAVDSFESYAMLDEGSDPIGSGLGFLLLISALIVLFTREKQAGHDLLANTFCIYGDDGK